MQKLARCVNAEACSLRQCRSLLVALLKWAQIYWMDAVKNQLGGEEEEVGVGDWKATDSMNQMTIRTGEMGGCCASPLHPHPLQISCADTKSSR